MHELSLAGGILGLVEDAARCERFARVRVLRLEAGALAGVDVQALRFALDAIAPGTCLAGARIDIDEPPATAWCMDCCRSVTIESRLDPCSLCGGARLQPTGGTSLRIMELLVDDEPMSTAEAAAMSSGA